MSTRSRRAMISLLPEWEPELDHLKKEHFYNDTQAEMFRCLIRLGLDALKNESYKGIPTKPTKENPA